MIEFIAARYRRTNDEKVKAFAKTDFRRAKQRLLSYSANNDMSKKRLKQNIRLSYRLQTSALNGLCCFSAKTSGAMYSGVPMRLFNWNSWYGSKTANVKSMNVTRTLRKKIDNLASSNFKAKKLYYVENRLTAYFIYY